MPKDKQSLTAKLEVLVEKVRAHNDVLISQGKKPKDSFVEATKVMLMVGEQLKPAHIFEVLQRRQLAMKPDEQKRFAQRVFRTAVKELQFQAQQKPKDFSR